MATFVAASYVGSQAWSQEVGPEDWESFVEQFVEDHLAAHPLGAAAAGRHEFDGLFPDWSRAGIAAETQRLVGWREAASRLDGASLTPAQELQRRQLLAIVRSRLFWLDRAELPFRNPSFYFDRTDGLDPSGYVTRDAPAAERLSGLTRLLENLPAAASQIKDNLRQLNSRPYIDYGVIRFGGLAQYIRVDLDGAFADVADARLLERYDAAREAAAVALDEVVASLRGQQSSGSNDFALGPELFLEMLRETESIDLALPELERIATEDLQRNLVALRETCESYAPGLSPGSCMEKMAANKPSAGPIETATSNLSILRSHVVDADLLTLPIPTEARVAEAPPFARTNLAYFMPTGHYEDKREAIFYIAGPDPAWSEEVQRDFLPGEGSLLSITAHEVLPGHYAHTMHGWVSDAVFPPDLFYSTLFVEGWAHYAEELLVETSFRPQDAEFRLGQLSWALQRNVRFLCAIGLHTKGMTVEECRAKFREEAFQDEGTARQQAARGAYEPIYLSYTLGKLLIRQLRDEWTRDRGGRAAWKQFHDEFLSYGTPPIPLIRDAMLSGRRAD